MRVLEWEDAVCRRRQWEKNENHLNETMVINTQTNPNKRSNRKKPWLWQRMAKSSTTTTTTT